MAGPTEPRSRLSLGARIFLATALIVTLAVAAAVAVTYLLGNQVADRAVRDALERSSWVQSTFQDGRIEQLRLASHLVAGDPSFVAYVAEAVGAGDIPSLRDALEDRQRDLGIAFAIVLDADGFVLAQAGDLLTLEEDFSAEPLYVQAREEYDAAGLWARGGQLFNAANVPIAAGALLQGFLITAEAIDDARADELRRINATDVTFILTPADGPPARVATTLEPDMADALMAAAAAQPGLLGPAVGEGTAPYHLEVELRRRPWLAQVRPLQDTGGRTLGAAVYAASLAERIEPFRRISSIFAAVGLAAILIALLISFLLPRRVLAPISQLAEAAQAAAGGDYDQEIEAKSSDEVGQLASSFSTLLSELREKRDMELYVNELSRSLPDAEAGGSKAAPAETSDAALLGIELRDYATATGVLPDQGPADPRQTLDTLTRDLRRISRTVRTQNGRIESLLGHRLVASFSGPRRCQQALSAAADVVAQRHPGGGPTEQSASARNPTPLAVALVAGPAVTGTVTLDNKPERAVAGWPVEQLEGLLRVARAGTLLFSKAVHDELAANLTEAGVTPQEHRSTVSSLPLFSLPADSVRRFSGPEGSATLEMTSVEPIMTGPVTLSAVGPGSVLAERFEILSELGAGGMGVVYKARDLKLGELVALKMLKHDVFGDAERLERLKDELRLARKISHPNVLRTFDFGDADGFPFISMEYVRGITLKQLLDQSGSLPLSAGLRLARQLCRGLWAAHSQSVLHRNIKPENLIIEPNGNAKLMDFGIARTVRRSRVAQTQPGTLIGTPYYLAPEQLEGLEADERADIYACGVVFYQIFTGNLPYPGGGNVMQVIQRKMNEDPKPPSSHWPTIPHTLEDIIMRCLERDPNNRFATVEALLKELEILRA